jgi:hypothetical protein
VGDINWENTYDSRSSCSIPFLENDELYGGSKFMSGWIGPRRAMLLLAIIFIAVGWYFKDYQIEILGETGSAGGMGIVLGVGLIFFVIFFSMMHTCR